MGIAPLAAVVLKRSGRGRDYLPVGTYPLPDDEAASSASQNCRSSRPRSCCRAGDTGNFWVAAYGLTRFRDLFTPRQLLDSVHARSGRT